MYEKNPPFTQIEIFILRLAIYHSPSTQLACNRMHSYCCCCYEISQFCEIRKEFIVDSNRRNGTIDYHRSYYGCGKFLSDQ